MTQASSTPKRNEVAIRVVFVAGVLLIWILPLGLFVSELVSAHKQYVVNTRYEPVPAAVLSSEVKTYKGSKGSVHYAPEVQYTYEVAGKSYQSDRLTAIWVSGGEDWAQSIVNRYKSDDSCTAYYDPQDPSRSVLLKRFYFEPYFYMLVMTFVLAGGSFLLLQAWGDRKRDPAPARNGWVEISPKLGVGQRLFISKLCTAIWYGFGIVPIAHYFTFVPAPHAHRSITIIEIFCLFGLIPLRFLVRYLRSTGGLSEAQLALDTYPGISGRPIKFSISQTARRRLEIKSAELRFHCIGTKVRGKSRQRQVLYEAVPVELKNQVLHAGEKLALSGEIKLPLEQPPSGRDATGKFTRIDWSVKFECRIAHEPRYGAEFPLLIQPAATERTESARAKPAVCADVRLIDARYRGQVLGKGSVFVMYLVGMLPLFFLVAGMLMIVMNYLAVFPDNKLLIPHHAEAHVWFATGAVVATVSAVFGLLWPNLLTGLYIRSMAARAISRRPDAIVRPGNDGLLVDVIPRANWNRMMLENATDIGFLAVDRERGEIRFEGDRERYRIPAGALISCELEKSTFVSGAKANAPGLWLVVIKAYGETGEWEAPVLPRLMNKPVQRTRFRKRAAEELQRKIKHLQALP